MTWEKLPHVHPGNNPCLHCPDPLPVLSMDSLVAVGFGDAHLERDGQMILNGEDSTREDWLTVQECENLG